MSLALLPVTTVTPPRRRGRKPVATDPAEQEKHLAIACKRIWGGKLVKQLAAEYDASERSIARWVKAAVTYDHPVARVLRASTNTRAN